MPETLKFMNDFQELLKNHKNSFSLKEFKFHESYSDDGRMILSIELAYLE